MSESIVLDTPPLKPGAHLDPTLAGEHVGRRAHESDRYCHQWDETTTTFDGSQVQFRSMCGFPAVGRLADKTTACNHHIHSQKEAAHG